MCRLKGLLCCALVIMLIFSLSGCGVKVSTKSPESVTKSIVNAYQKGDTEAVKKCFGLDPDKKCAEEITQEIKYNMKQFEAYGASEVNFTKCESLGNFNGYDLVYAIYNLIKKDKDDKKSEALEIPSMSMYFVKEKDKKYHVVPAKDVTDELSKISSEEFSKFMKTDVYKTYEKDYKKFIRKNPNFEENMKKEMEK